MYSGYFITNTAVLPGSTVTAIASNGLWKTEIITGCINDWPTFCFRAPLVPRLKERVSRNWQKRHLG